MFDIAPTELLLVAVVALVVIGPKDMPRALRTVGKFVGRIRGVARQFRSGFDDMVRQAELEEMEKSWAKENARIMALHPAPADAPHDAEFAHGDQAMLPLPDHGSVPGELPLVSVATPSSTPALASSADPAPVDTPSAKSPGLPAAHGTEGERG